MQLEKLARVRPYEAVILMNPDSSENDQKALFKRNKSIIEEQFKGEVKHLDTWGKRRLANPIGKSKHAVFFHTTFIADPQAIAELERTMRINDNVLRYMHTALDVRKDIVKYVEDFKSALAESTAREREREAKFQARKAASRGGRRDDDGFRGGRRDEDNSRSDDDGDIEIDETEDI